MTYYDSRGRPGHYRTMGLVRSAAAIDAGLRNYKIRIYTYMAGRMSAGTAQMLFWIYAAVMGISLGGIFLIYTGTSIARVLFITATTFGAITLGYATNRDLPSIGSLLFMGLIGLVIASIVNIFLGSSTLQFVISIVGVMVFVGLTAYDTQRIKEIYLESDGTEAGCKKAILGALSLYLDFINLLLLQIERSFLRQTERDAPLRVS